MVSTSRKEHIMAKRAAKGAGSVHKRTYTRNGKQYTYWEARVTTGRYKQTALTDITAKSTGA